MINLKPQAIIYINFSCLESNYFLHVHHWEKGIEMEIKDVHYYIVSR